MEDDCMKETKNKAVVSFTPDEIQKLRLITMDKDTDEALKFIKEILKRINESANKTLNVGI
jgi:hypothetical protein